MALEVLRSLEGFERWVALRAGGPLESDFDVGADRMVREPSGSRFGEWVSEGVAAKGWARGYSAPLLARLGGIPAEVIARRILRQTGPALVYANSARSANYVRPALAMGIPVVLHLHEEGEVLRAALGHYRLWCHARGLRLVACGDAVRREVETLYPGVEVAVVHEAIDVAAVRRAGAQGRWQEEHDRSIVVGACATVEHRKGPDHWLDMAEVVLREAPDVRFVWVGAGPLLEEMRAEVVRRRLQERVAFVGHLANPHGVLSGVDIVTLTSRADPFPLAILEGMALARPVVAFDVGGLREQVGTAGVIVGSSDVAGMARAVIDLLQRPKVRADLGASAARRVEVHFDVLRFREQARAIVDELACTGALR